MNINILASLAIVVATSALAIHQIAGHYSNPVHEELQTSYCRILWLPTVCGLLAWLSLCAPQYELFFSAAAVCYDALALNILFNILVKYAGGAEEFTSRLEQRKAPLYVMPIAACPAANHEQQLGSWRLCMWQVLALPVWALLYAIAMEIDRHDFLSLSCRGTKVGCLLWNPLVNGIMLMHAAIAMAALFAMYRYCHFEEFQGLGMELKWATVKLVLLLHIVSKMVLGFVSPSVGDGHRTELDEEVLTVEAYVTVVEMFLLGVIFYWVFNADDPALHTAVRIHGESRLLEAQQEKEELMGAPAGDASS